MAKKPVPEVEPASAPSEENTSSQGEVTPPPYSPPTLKEVSVEDVLRMQESLDHHREAAIEALLIQRREIEQKLQRLGYQAPESNLVTMPPRQKAAVGGKSIRADAYCKYCQIKGHDARLHRGQEKKKKFTPAELEVALAKK